jgi:hypothetical protein
MKRFLLLSLVAGLFATPTQARIGYTLDQCVKEYGPYKTRQSWVGTVYDFQVKDERVTVVILKDAVSAIDYARLDKVQFTINELDDLLDENKGNSIWAPPHPNLTEGLEHKWLTESGPELIAYDGPGGLSVLTKAQEVLDTGLKMKQQKDALATKEGAQRYIQEFYRSTGSQATVVSCSTFVPKTFSDRRYLLAKAALSYSDASKLIVGVIASLSNEDMITETEAMEENKFYRFVTTGDTGLLHQETTLDVNAKPTSTPEAPQEVAFNRDKLRQLIAHPTSDMSLLSREEVEEAAQLDAQSYYAKHRQKNYNSNLGEARALKHNLLGSLALAYDLSLEGALKALATADASEN